MAKAKTVTVEKELTETPPGEEREVLEPVELDLEGGASPTPEVVVETTAEVPKPAAEEDPIVAKLKSDLEAAQRASQQKDVLLAGKDAEIQNVRGQVQSSQVNQIEAALEAANANAENLERTLAEAYQQGDFNKVAKTQREIARVEAQITRLEDGRDSLKSTPPEAPRIADPVEQIIAANPSLPQRDREWLRAHPDAVTNSDKFQQLQATAAYAARKFGQSTDGYYKFIEEDLGYTPREATPVTPQAPAAPSAPQRQQQRQPNYAAPVSRETLGGNGSRGETSRIRLSPAQRQAAKDSGCTDAEYAKNLKSLVESGQLPATAIEYV
ncbi:MAG: hypothetical protein KGL39_04505 [Patescibacteria group bacterium]|nr:hypothetical protein [Patescibacteria group bacterium]